MVSRFSRICLSVAGAGAIALFAPSQMAAARQQTLPAPVAPTLEEVVAAPPIKPALWLVRDADTTIYLFGTVHLLKPGLNWLNGPVADGLARSDSLVTEIVKTPESDAAMQKAVQELAMLPETQSLRTLMQPAARTSFEALLKRQGMPADLFDRFEPWYPALVLSMLPLMKQGLHPDAGVEEKLTQAHGGRARDGLETARFQIELFDGLSQAAQLEYLASVVTHYDEIVPQMDELVDAWGMGKPDTIASIMLENMDSPELVDVLIRKRNEAWGNWIRRRLAEPGTIFMAVGAGHLAGPDSVQQFLATSGVRTERVQ